MPLVRRASDGLGVHLRDHSTQPSRTVRRYRFPAQDEAGKFQPDRHGDARSKDPSRPESDTIRSTIRSGHLSLLLEFHVGASRQSRAKRDSRCLFGGAIEGQCPLPPMIQDAIHDQRSMHDIGRLSPPPSHGIEGTMPSYRRRPTSPRPRAGTGRTPQAVSSIVRIRERRAAHLATFPCQKPDFIHTRPFATPSGCGT